MSQTHLVTGVTSICQDKGIVCKTVFLNFSTNDILGQIFLCCECAILCIVSYLVASLTSNYLLPVVITVSKHC